MRRDGLMPVWIAWSAQVRWMATAHSTHSSADGFWGALLQKGLHDAAIDYGPNVDPAKSVSCPSQFDYSRSKARRLQMLCAKVALNYFSHSPPPPPVSSLCSCRSLIAFSSLKLSPCLRTPLLLSLDIKASKCSSCKQVHAVSSTSANSTMLCLCHHTAWLLGSFGPLCIIKVSLLCLHPFTSTIRRIINDVLFNFLSP